MKKYPCEKCGTRHRPSRHHILPKCFFGGYGGIAWLCTYCHREIEDIILEAEIKASGSPIRRRYRLHQEKYYSILKNFLSPVEITYNLLTLEII